MMINEFAIALAFMNRVVKQDLTYLISKFACFAETRNDDQILNWKAVPVTDILGDVAANIAPGVLGGLAHVVALQERDISMILAVTDHKKVTGHILTISTDDRRHRTVVDRYHAIEATQEEINKRAVDIAAIGG